MAKDYGHHDTPASPSSCHCARCTPSFKMACPFPTRPLPVRQPRIPTTCRTRQVIGVVLQNVIEAPQAADAFRWFYFFAAFPMLYYIVSYAVRQVFQVVEVGTEWCANRGQR